MKHDIYQISKEYQQGLTTIELGKKYHISDETVRYYLKKLNIPRRTRKYSFDDTVFELIDTEHKAYWLGFIYADGNIYKNTLSIKLGLQDCQHLQYFKQLMKYSGNLELTEKYGRIRIYSPRICIDLNKLGIFPNKATTIEFPSLPTNLIHHFIRGFFDGDGWLSQNILGFSSCSAKFIKSIQSYICSAISRQLGCIVIRHKNHPKWNTNYQLTFGGPIAVKAISDYLWNQSSIQLERKRFQLI